MVKRSMEKPILKTMKNGIMLRCFPRCTYALFRASHSQIFGFLATSSVALPLANVGIVLIVLC